MKNTLHILIYLVVTMHIAAMSQSSGQSSEDKIQVRNVILMIGDGMGLAQVSTLFVEGIEPNISRLSHVGLIKTHSATEKITDSAAAGTALSTGFKTNNGAIGVDMNGEAKPTLCEIFHDLGWKNGLVATSSITHATPASFYAHVSGREMHQEIAVALSETPAIDFFSGGGLQYFFNQRRESNNYLDTLRSNGYQVYGSESVLGPRTSGLNLSSIDELDWNKKYARFGSMDALNPISKGRGDFLPNETSRALEFLGSSGKGFFLMVEGSQIDWGGHDNNYDYVVGEMMDFDKTIGVVMDYAESHPNTLVIITADHETGGLALKGDETASWDNPLTSPYNVVKGSFSTDGHTATLIPVFAFGPGADVFTGLYDNTDIFHKIIHLTTGID